MMDEKLNERFGEAWNGMIRIVGELEEYAQTLKEVDADFSAEEVIDCTIKLKHIVADLQP